MTGGYDATIAVAGTDWFFLDGVQVSNASGANQAIMLNSMGQTNCLVSNVITEGVGSDAVINARTCRLVNSLIVLRRAITGSAIKAPYNGTMAWTGVTMVRPSNFAAGGNAIQLNSSTTTLKNSMIFGFAAISNVNMAAGSSNNCSDIAIPFGTSNQASKTYANQFVTSTDTGRDFRKKAGSDGIDTGLTDTTNNPAANDIYGTARPQGSAWDIGADEVPAASGNTATIAWSEADDITAITANISNIATIAWTEANDTTAIIASIQNNTAISWTEANDMTSITASVVSSASIAWIEDDDISRMQAATVISNIQNSGGYFPHIPRRDPDKVRRDRIKFGILPDETKQSIETVAKKTANQDFTEKKIISLLKEELKSSDIPFKAKLASILISERSNIIQKAAETAIKMNASALKRKKAIKYLLLD